MHKSDGVVLIASAFAGREIFRNLSNDELAQFNKIM